MLHRIPLACRAVLLAGLLASCSSARETSPREYNDLVFGPPPENSLSGGNGLTIFSNEPAKAAADQGGALGVNAYLWRGALDTLAFMPLSSADPFGGVIITDWYSPPAAQGERFKATAYILGRQLRADAVRVSLFRQVLQNGQWVDAPVSTGTAGEMEDKILLRARELRAQSGG